jgi:hypothetical protein
MVNRPKNIGTWTETQVVKVARNYYPKADRAALRGAGDIGDLINTGPLCIEVKGGAAARGAANASSSALIEKWLLDTERERKAAGARFGVLVLHRGGVGGPDARRWWAIVNAAAFADIMGAAGHVNDTPIRLELGALLDILADQGFTEDAPAAPPEPDPKIRAAA